MQNNHDQIIEPPCLFGTGKITVIMVVNLGRFMAEGDEKSRDLFRSLRGSPEYMDYLQDLPGSDMFTRLSSEIKGSDPWIESQGYEIGVFHHHLKENWFFPTFELDKDAAKIETTENVFLREPVLKSF